MAIDHDFEKDLAIVGAGHIGLPWGAALSDTCGYTVTCVDIDERRVTDINEATSPFSEPGLQATMARGVEAGTLRATTDPAEVVSHKYVAFTLNAPRRHIERFVDTFESYLQRLVDGQIVVVRSTVPVGTISELAEIVEAASADLTFAVFPERLAEGVAIREIHELPKVYGVRSDEAATAMETLLDPLGCEHRRTDPETAMFVKLVDNAYRDAKFAISNQIAFIADVLDLDAHETIEHANYDYSRNDVPTPGTVGGKCLPKDPHFLMDEFISDQPTTPDLFHSTRHTNQRIQSYVTTQILVQQPTKVAMLGLAYKKGVADQFNSPAADIRDALLEQGVTVESYDPHASSDRTLGDVLSGADVVVLAVNHDEFLGIEADVNRYADPGGIVYDVWGTLDSDALDLEYTGFGIN